METYQDCVLSEAFNALNLNNEFNTFRNEFLPTGIPSLDAIFGNGIPVGSLVLIYGDKLGAFSDIILKTFVSQGVVNEDDIYFASCDTKRQTFMSELPRKASSSCPSQNPSSQPPLKIAWRYENNLPISSLETPATRSSDSFDFRQFLSSEIIDGACISSWSSKDSSNVYKDLISDIESVVKSKHCYNLKTRTESDSVIRIALHNVGSLLWKDSIDKLPIFLYKLRSLLHSSHAIAFVTVPKFLCQNHDIVYRCDHMSDIVMELTTIDPNKNTLYDEIDGIIKFKKYDTRNSLLPIINDAKDWAFKLLYKKLIIKKIRLPPEDESSQQREGSSTKSGMSCLSASNKLDF